MTRTQAIAGIRRERLVWIAAPAHRLDELRAEPQESPLRSTGQSEREQPTGDVAGLPRPREYGAQRRRGERSGPFLLLDPRRDVLNERRRRRAAGRHDLPAAHQRHPIGAHHPHQFLRAREQDLEHIVFRRALAHRAGQLILRRSTRGALGELVAVLERGDLERGQATEKLTRHPRLLRNAPRAGVVQAADESPQAVANDERDAHGSADSHVGHVLEVNGRDAAQNRKAEVQRTARVHAEGRNDARWLGAGIEDEPKPVLAIQLARLGRDVGGRIVQPEIRLERWFLRLAVDGAMPVLVESIEQDPLEPGDSPHLLNDDVRELGGRDHALNPQERRPKRVAHRDGWTRIRLELENGRSLVAVDDSVELFSVRADLQRVHVVPALLAAAPPSPRRPTPDPASWRAADPGPLRHERGDARRRSR